jgi:hypothetical protein
LLSLTLIHSSGLDAVNKFKPKLQTSESDESGDDDQGANSDDMEGNEGEEYDAENGGISGDEGAGMMDNANGVGSEHQDLSSIRDDHRQKKKGDDSDSELTESQLLQKAIRSIFFCQRVDS